ncbi:hypothetical protein HPT25_28155 [Bacillus sp. BRMEA1]|uniref:hypothetical protein n=1 Tax=Neobacillus endophyticus TaxID=2738405 RepID=UPI00156612EB|nr:hypothetical protein [Neobacillus endophyticus]NRD81169.1 hypothetical protein [Neobacillus endophyticus]
MSKFSAKVVKRSIRDFESAASDILNAGYNTYKARIKRFVSIINEDSVINSIVTPLMNLSVDFDQIHTSNNGFWVTELNLPTEIDGQIAYVLQIFSQVSKGELSLEGLSHRIYKHSQLDENIQQFVLEVASPCLRELLNRLNDLVEDVVDGKEEITGSTLQIFNYGHINASGGSNIAIGKEINQTSHYENIVNKIMDEVNKHQLIPEEKKAEVEKVANEVQEEISKPAPSPSKLKALANKLYGIGEAALLKVFSKVVTDPQWGQAASQAIFDHINL